MRKVYIQTYGCQMNEYDSDQMRQILSNQGFENCSSPLEANLILINSCSVREKSEVKALSFLGRMAQLKANDPSKIIGFGGCVGQTEGPKLLKRYPMLDFAFGTNNYRELPRFLEEFKNRLPEEDPGEVLLPSSRPDSRCQAFITITNGCDKFCSYCIVPFTRGRELSRSPEEILTEAESLVARGIKEIMLLGQNVNSYWGKNKKGEPSSLHDLLVMFQNESEGSGRLNGLKRLRYTTSHPRDFDEALARDFRDLPILCEYLHLPFQSGSDSVLRRMRRFYTMETYVNKMRMVREYRPDIALSTDVIVGFPGETDDDFQSTMNILQELEFDNVYAFKYSARPYTRSADFDDDVPEPIKSERINRLVEFQREMSAKRYREDLNQTVEVMLEGPSHHNETQWTGRTRKNRVVHFAYDPIFKVGDIRHAKILHSTNSWMQGEVVDLSKEPIYASA